MMGVVSLGRSKESVNPKLKRKTERTLAPCTDNLSSLTGVFSLVDSVGGSSSSVSFPKAGDLDLRGSAAAFGLSSDA